MRVRGLRIRPPLPNDAHLCEGFARAEFLELFWRLVVDERAEHIAEAVLAVAIRSAVTRLVVRIEFGQVP